LIISPYLFTSRPKKLKGDGYMGITAQLMQQKLGTPVFNNTWVKFANIREFPGINADNFSVDCTLRNTSTPANRPALKPILPF
jgi:hypothetical protein